MSGLPNIGADTVIHAMTPFRADMNLGRAYNEEMERLPEGHWAAFFDHDMMLTTPHWHAQLEEAIACRPDAGAFTAVTNRIASSWQRAPESLSAGNDIVRHRQIGERRRQVRTLLDITCTKGFGGVVTLLSKEAWRESGGYSDGMYCCDHSLFFRLVDAGRRVYLIEGLYVFHMRASSSANPPLAAPKVEGCRCRGPEVMPTERISLQ